MNNTKIDWADMTWNPVTGCLYGCSYCYARRIANRFGMGNDSYKGESLVELNEPFRCATLNDNLELSSMIRPYPAGFKPTFHKYRLEEPKKAKKSKNIFVCSMADLFGDWVPHTWISAIFAECEAVPRHNYLFLTKNPDRYDTFKKHYTLLNKKNIWYGTTVNNYKDFYTKGQSLYFATTGYANNFLYIEPITEDMADERVAWFDWVIVGAETGNRKGKVIPKKEWIMSILEPCKTAGIPVFMKESLRELMGNEFVQEMPEGLRR